MSVALPSRARLFLALLVHCFMALFFAGLTVVGGLLIVIVISDDPAVIDAIAIPLAVAVNAMVSGLMFALTMFGMQKATAVDLLPPPHLLEDDE